MADYVLVNRSASAVEGVAPGTAAKVTLLDANLAAALAVAGVAVFKPGTPGEDRKALADAVEYWPVIGDAASNRMG